MIKSVNFIESREWRWTYGMLTGIAACILVAAAAMEWGESRSLSALEKTVGNLQAQVNQQLVELSPEKAVAKLSAGTPPDELAVLYTALSTAPQWSLVMGEVLASLPRGIYLVEMAKTAPASLAVRGTAVRSDLLSQWIETLGTQSTIAAVTLGPTKTVATAQSAEQTFELAILLKVIPPNSLFSQEGALP